MLLRPRRALCAALLLALSMPVLASDLIAPIKLDTADLNPDAPACDDLNAFVNSRWLAQNPVPADRTTWGTFETLAERSLSMQRQIAEDAAKAAASSGVDKLIGDFYATGMDEEAINAQGVAPLQPTLDRIAALDSPQAIAAWLRDNFAQGQGFLFGFGGEADFKNSTMTIAYTSQGGTSLPEKGYYTLDREDYAKIREAFRAHVQKTLELSGVDVASAAEQAQWVFDFEKRLADASLSRVEMRNPAVFYNPVSLADAEKLTPNFSWAEFFKAQGVAAPEMFSLAQPKFFEAFNAMLVDVPVAHWQAYLRFHAIDGAAPYLGDALAEQNFSFYGKTLRGQQEQQPRWKRVLNELNGQMGEALGQAYVARTFPPEAKAQALELVNHLSAALKVRIEQLDWMSDATKVKALEKWASFTPKIGYPDVWRDWSGAQTARSSYLNNVLSLIAFNYRYNLNKIGKPVDKSTWEMSPQTVNAYYNPLRNEIVFPAAILQPPFFDPGADPAVNYGGIGAVIGHEMIHGYDDQGSKFDAQGNFSNWWTDEDRKGFEARTDKLVSQFSSYVAIDGLKVKGDLTLGENIADLGGLSVAFDAMNRYLSEHDEWKTRQIDGYDQAQRFFMNWATVWRRNFKDEELKLRLDTDSHAPAGFRAIGAPSNMGSFAAAFNCSVKDKMVRPADVQVAIW